MLGLIETKRKRGMILTNPDILGTLERVMDTLIMDKDTLQDVFELRLVLEMGMADLLYISKTDKDNEEQEEIVDIEEERKEHTLRIKNEIDFHGKQYEIRDKDNN